MIFYLLALTSACCIRIHISLLHAKVHIKVEHTVNILTLILSSRAATLADSRRSNNGASSGALATDSGRCVRLNLNAGTGADGVVGEGLSSVLDESSFDRRLKPSVLSSLPGKPFKDSLVL